MPTMLAPRYPSVRAPPAHASLAVALDSASAPPRGGRAGKHVPGAVPEAGHPAGVGRVSLLVVATAGLALIRHPRAHRKAGAPHRISIELVVPGAVVRRRGIGPDPRPAARRVLEAAIHVRGRALCIDPAAAPDSQESEDREQAAFEDGEMFARSHGSMAPPPKRARRVPAEMCVTLEDRARGRAGCGPEWHAAGVGMSRASSFDRRAACE